MAIICSHSKIVKTFTEAQLTWQIVLYPAHRISEARSAEDEGIAFKLPLNKYELMTYGCLSVLYPLQMLSIEQGSSTYCFWSLV